VERAVAAEGLLITCRHTLTLTPADTRVLWQEYTDDGHVLTRALLDRYLCGGPSEVLHLRGHDAFEAARRVKRAVRSRHAMGPFANVVHAAEQPGELARQGAHLAERCGCAPPPPDLTPAPAAVRPTGHDFRPGTDIAALVDAVWPKLQADLAAPAPHRLDAAVEAALYLGADRAHTLDSSVTAVWRALPGVELADALLLTLYAGRTGDYPIAIGSRDAVGKAYQVMLQHGVRACAPGPYTLRGC
jgi:hypothetical protein